MITFFVILAVLMVLVVAAGAWSSGPRRRVIYERSPIRREPRPEVVEEIVEEPVARTETRRVVRRRRGL